MRAGKKKMRKMATPAMSSEMSATSLVRSDRCDGFQATSTPVVYLRNRSTERTTSSMSAVLRM